MAETTDIARLPRVPLIGSHLCGGDCDDPCDDPDPVRPDPRYRPAPTTGREADDA